MLTREKVEHGLRAAAEILRTDELVLIGSATALFQDGRYTARMALSDEIDTYSAHHHEEDREALLVIGTGSQFNRTHGFYVDGVSPETARMPENWRDRATTTPLRSDPSIRVTVPELNDIALSKMIAWREKDIGWLEDAAMLGRIDPVAMAARIDSMPLHRIEMSSEELNRRLQVLARYAGPAAVAALAGLPSEPVGPLPVRAEGASADDRSAVERELRGLRANDLNVRIADTVASLAAPRGPADAARLRFGLAVAADHMAARGLVHPNEAVVAAMEASLGRSSSRGNPGRER